LQTSRYCVSETGPLIPSQIIAAEQTRRRCFALELSPAFVDVAVRRWEKATSKTAALEGEGQTFAEVAAERGVA
jgi:DNA modification methylase